MRRARRARLLESLSQEAKRVVLRRRCKSERTGTSGPVLFLYRSRQVQALFDLCSSRPRSSATTATSSLRLYMEPIGLQEQLRDAGRIGFACSNFVDVDGRLLFPGLQSLA
jgi:hypothetical protein